MRIVTPEDATEVQSTPPVAQEASREVRFTPGAIVANRYRIVSLVGGGGMGEVYRADDLKLGQRVALKYVPLRDARSLEQLLNEVRVGRQISHPNVCRLHDVVEVDGQHFITMEYVDGEDLASLLRRIGRLPNDKALALTRDICAGLAAAHDRGFVHRDLKPANIMIDGRGSARITDFGLTSAAGSGHSEFAGTPAYMAPEQLDRLAATPRTDIYALGLVMYEMFTGQRLFDGRSLDVLREQHANTKTRPTSIVREIEPAIERVILRCLEEDPHARPSSVQEILLALPGGDPLQAAVAAGETPSPEMVAAASRTGELPLGRAWMMLAIALVLLAGVVSVRQRSTIMSRLPEIKSPEVLNDRARAVIEELGYERAPHSAGLFIANATYVRDTIAKKEPLDPIAVPFLFRDSPEPILPFNPYAWVRRNDPAPVLPGMTTVLLDAEGNLRDLRRVPEATAPHPALRATLSPQAGRGARGGGPSPRVRGEGGRRPDEGRAAFDWTPAFRAAGLDIREFRETAPAFPSPVGSDARIAWIRERDSLRVEAATSFGAPVWFALPEAAMPPLQATTRALLVNDPLAVILAVMLFVFMVFARRNVTRGRADTRGALRVALATTLAILGGLILIARHTTAPADEWEMLTYLAGIALYYGFVAWLSYLALEPFVRRRWPNMLVGWTRFVSGRFRDPLVGRELLIGIIISAAGLIIDLIGLQLVSSILPVVPTNPLTRPPMRAPAGIVFLFLDAATTALTFGLGLVAMLVVMRRIVRHDRAAWIVTTVIVIAAAGSDSLPRLIDATATMIAVVLALRFGGVLGGITAFFVYYVSTWSPLTWNTQAWYFNRSMVTVLVLAALTLYAFRTALGHRPLLGSALVEDEANA